MVVDWSNFLLPVFLLTVEQGPGPAGQAGPAEPAAGCVSVFKRQKNQKKKKKKKRGEGEGEGFRGQGPRPMIAS